MRLTGIIDRLRRRWRNGRRPAQAPPLEGSPGRARFVVLLAERRRRAGRRPLLAAAVVALCITGSGLFASTALRRGEADQGAAISVQPGRAPVSPGRTAAELAGAPIAEPTVPAEAFSRPAPAGGSDLPPALEGGDELAGLRRDFDRFLDGSGHRRKRLSEQQRAVLFQQYLEWRAKSSTVREAGKP